MKIKIRVYSNISMLALALAHSVVVFAQKSPDAGRTLKELESPLEMPKPSRGITIDPPPTAASTQSDETQVVIRSVYFSGNTLFSEAQLQATLSDIIGKPFDFSGLRNLTTRVLNVYRQAGYPFTRVTLSPQPIIDGKLVINVLEGKYGKISVTGDTNWNTSAEKFLYPLKHGALIESTLLERAVLLLEDQPGAATVATIEPGQEVGEGDLHVKLSRSKFVSGNVDLDNYGNRYSGEYRGRLNLQANSPFLFGDQLSFSSLVSDERLWLGSLAYELPLGSSGLRGQIGYAYTSYRLGKQFAVLDASGIAKVASLGFSYPFLRSKDTNVLLGAVYQRKELEDKQNINNSKSDKTSDTLPITLRFDKHDSWAGGGVTYGEIGWTVGNLKLDAQLEAIDKTTAKTSGVFHKFNLDIAHLHILPKSFSFFGRFSGQLTSKNLDSSQSFGLGGATGVRAYPAGEAYGDEGGLIQLELRYAIHDFSPYVFYDAGWVRVNAKPWDSAENHQNISGAGLGLRFSHQKKWKIDAALAWRTYGGKPQSDTRDRFPMVWATAGYQF